MKTTKETIINTIELTARIRELINDSLKYRNMITECREKYNRRAPVRLNWITIGKI